MHGHMNVKKIHVNILGHSDVRTGLHFIKRLHNPISAKFYYCLLKSCDFADCYGSLYSKQQAINQFKIIECSLSTLCKSYSAQISFHVIDGLILSVYRKAKQFYSIPCVLSELPVTCFSTLASSAGGPSIHIVQAGITSCRSLPR